MKIEYTLAIDSTEGGTVEEPGEGTFEYEHGSVVGLEAVPEEHHHFVGWTGDIDSVEDTESPETSIVIEGDHSITAEFAVNIYALDIEVVGEGTVEEPGEGTFEYEYGSVVELEALPEEHHHFLGWTGDIDNVEDTESPETSIVVEGDHSITAEFGVKIRTEYNRRRRWFRRRAWRRNFRVRVRRRGGPTSSSRNTL